MTLSRHDKESPQSPFDQLLYSRCQDSLVVVGLLEKAARISMERRFGTTAEAMMLYGTATKMAALLNIDIQGIAHGVFLLIQQAATYENSEVFLHRIFEKHHSTLIPGSIIVEGIKSQKHIPDFWIEVDRELIPVEIKKHRFDFCSLGQLKRYVREFKVRRGVAVAPELTVDLPQYASFVKLDIEKIAELEGYTQKRLEEIIPEAFGGES